MSQHVKILIVENDLILSQNMTDQLEELGYEQIFVANTSAESTELFHSKAPDLVVMDIDLGETINGINLASSFKRINRNLRIIFLSGLESNEVFNETLLVKPNAFLNKPFNAKVLSRTIDVAMNNEENLTDNSKNEPSAETLFVKKDKKYVTVPVTDILFLHAQGSYCEITTSDDQFLLSQNLNKCEQSLSNKKFIRIHRSYVINVNKVTGLYGNMVQIGSYEIQMGKGKREELSKVIKFL